jgi:hypothetical protein
LNYTYIKNSNFYKTKMDGTIIQVRVQGDETMTAKIINQTRTKLKIVYLNNSVEKPNVYNYEDVQFEISKDCVEKYYDSVREEEAGFTKTSEGFIIAEDEDSDYEPTDSEDPESEDYSSDEEDLED